MRQLRRRRRSQHASASPHLVSFSEPWDAGRAEKCIALVARNRRVTQRFAGRQGRPQNVDRHPRPYNVEADKALGDSDLSRRHHPQRHPPTYALLKFRNCLAACVGHLPDGYSSMLANAALCCQSNKADRSSWAHDDGLIGRDL
jgi:hypothetical protein